MRFREMLLGMGLYLLSLAVGLAFGVPALVQAVGVTIGAIGLLCIGDATGRFGKRALSSLLNQIRSLEDLRLKKETKR